MGCNSSSPTSSPGNIVSKKQNDNLKPSRQEKEESSSASKDNGKNHENQVTTQSSERNEGVDQSAAKSGNDTQETEETSSKEYISEYLEDDDAKNPEQNEGNSPDLVEPSEEQNTGEEQVNPTDADEREMDDDDLSEVNDQERFNTAIRCACELFKADSVLQFATRKITTLALQNALPNTLSLSSLLVKLPNLQEVDISGNNIGPQGFRSIILGLCNNCSITSLNISNNMADTDSSECIGKMLSTNKCLEILDVSGNHLGKDYFSRCVGPAFSCNTSLQVLRCESIGATDLLILTENCIQNNTLVELSISHNDLLDSTQLVQNISNWLQFDKCNLTSLIMKNCGLKGNDLSTLTDGLNSNSSLSTLNVSSNQTRDTSGLLDLLLSCILHSCVTSLSADDIKFETVTKTWEPKFDKVTKESRLSSLSLSGCQLCDQHLDSLQKLLARGVLASLNNVNLNKNPDLTLQSISHIVNMTTENSVSKLKKLSWGLNSADGIAELLTSRRNNVKLEYLNIRKSKITSEEVGKVSSIVGRTEPNNGLKTLVLDGIKLSGCNALHELLASDTGCSLVALSLSGCSLADKDIQPLATAIGRNIPLIMLKLSANRLTDKGVMHLVDAVLSHTEYSLQLIDLMNNKIEDTGAKKLCELFTSSVHKTKIHSLNLSNNNIGSEGVAALVSLVHQTSLTSLQVSSQQCQYEEEDMDLIITSLIKALGCNIGSVSGSDAIEQDSLPDLKSSVSVKLTGLGGNAGALGGKIDCTAFPTDLRNKKLSHLSLQHALELTAAFKGQGEDGERCVLSQEEWKMITSADKESPSWLQLHENREACVYISHLPAAITVQKMEAVLEMEADCSVQEIFLLKDPVFRKNTGVAWALLGDAENVMKAVQFMNEAQAQVFSQAFIISKICVQISDEANEKYVAEARQDLLKRMEQRKAEEVKHRALIRQSYAESQARHAYRRAHPAYADGRIW